MSHHVTNQAGCRIHFGNFGLQQLATVTQELPSHLFGPQNLFQVAITMSESTAHTILLYTTKVTRTRHVFNAAYK